MVMKWNPVIDGDLSGIPEDEEFLFTIVDKEDGESYVTTAYIVAYDGELEVWEDTASGRRIYEEEYVKAWMELPEPYQQGGCDMCKHLKQWTDEFGDGSAECELHKNVPFTKIKPGECPLNR